MSTIKLRRYGAAPFRIAVVHGGPGAGGEMAAVARVIAEKCGVLEPIQTQTSLQEQVEELHDLLVREAAAPVVLVGFSWGAWLSVLLASKYSGLVGKIVLVSSGAFEERYVTGLSERRLSRLPDAERAQLRGVLAALDDPDVGHSDSLLAQLGRLTDLADTYASIDEVEEANPIPVNGEIFGRVWAEAAKMRRTGALLQNVRNLTCPVVAIHGDSDPSLAAGVCEPLTANLVNFRFILLERCGHTPWQERFARETFYEILLPELA
jgi:pimeloyl-ACP methyl ester carboxylesterase